MATLSAPHHGGQAAQRVQLALIAVLVLALAAIGVALLVHRGGPPGSGVQGSGVAATQARAVPSFSSIDLAGSHNVAVFVGAPQSVVVHADSNLLGNVTTRVVAGTLVLGNTGSFTTKSPMGVVINVPSLAAVTLSGNGDMLVNGINAPRLTVTISGNGVLYASGTATRLDVTLGGSGEAQLNQLVARDVHAVVSGSGVIEVTATTSLDAAIPGAGAIIYSGNPQRVTSSVTGTGAVTRG